MRTTIIIPDEDYKKLKEFCQKKEMKISGLLRLGARNIIANKK